MAAARPLVTVHAAGADGASSTAKMPAVFLAPIRHDIVQFVHTNMRKNRRQAYAVSPGAGHQHSAESWGTGRAVSRIPRVSGSGTARAGQGAFGNMCRKGRMFAPTKTFRRWHRKINKNQRRFATVSALAASALPSLVMARGHRISQVPEIPLVVSKDAAEVKKTKDAVALLKLLGAEADLVKAKESKRSRAGKGKGRGRRYLQRKGPLVVFKSNRGIVKACRNLPGVDLCHVSRLNLLQLAPGGHLGRFIVWTEDAFKALDGVFGTTTQASKQKFGYTLPRSQMTNGDLSRIINSDEIQSKINPKKRPMKRPIRKKNPLKNLGVMVRLNPYNMVTRRAAIRLQQQRAASRAAKKDANRKQTKAQRKAKDFNKKHRAQKKATWQSIIRD